MAERLPAGVNTVRLVDSRGRHWATMSREEFEMASDDADVFKAALTQAMKPLAEALLRKQIADTSPNANALVLGKED